MVLASSMGSISERTCYLDKIEINVIRNRSFKYLANSDLTQRFAFPN
jgi:hypothetical protein